MGRSDHMPVCERRAGDEEAITTLAARQHGVVARTQLLAAGVSEDVVDRRVKANRLRRIHRGVYLVGPFRVPRAHEMAAVLACGGGALVSHASAAALLELHGERDPSEPVAVSAQQGDPLTAVARTIYDLASVVGQRELERAVANAVSRSAVHVTELRALLQRYPRGKGAGRLRALIDADALPALTRSEAEKRFLALIRKAGLPAPAVNVSVARYVVDFFWRAERFIVEVDGFAFHSSAHRFEADRRRDAELAAAGMRVMRVTWRQLANEPLALVVRLAQALAR